MGSIYNEILKMNNSMIYLKENDNITASANFDNLNCYDRYIVITSEKLVKLHNLSVLDAIVLARAYWKHVYTSELEYNWNTEVSKIIDNHVQNNTKFGEYLEIEMKKQYEYYPTLKLEECFAIAKYKWNMLLREGFILK